MKNINFIWIIICFIFTVNAQIEYPKDFFSSPVDMKLAIAGTFGELRNNHFHSGIDIKTRQKTNIPIYAAQDGYISRIKVATYGFGKALYIVHSNGFTTVYAHLERFNQVIAKRALTEHYKRIQCEIDFSLKKNEIKIKKGEIIGFSGNTGSSTAPHLHFEIRDTKTQKIINPMLFGLPILDTTYPIIKSILIYRANGKKEVISVKKINKNTYQLIEKIRANEPFNIGVKTYDLLDAAPNKNGIYSLQLYLNDSLLFQNTMNTFSFHETKYINSHIDYAYYQNHGEKFQKCFLDPNNNLSTNKKNIKNSIGDSLRNGMHQIKIIIQDSYENNSELIFDFEFNKQNSISQEANTTNTINYEQVFEFKTKDFDIYIPNNSLYKNYPFQFEKTIHSDLKYPIYKILDDSIPLHKSFIISMSVDSLEKELRQKAMIAKIHEDEFHCIKSTWQENRIIGKSNSLGKFTIVIDTIKPTIKYNKIDNNAIEFIISDELSGIAEYRGQINEKWILMEYDFKTNLIKHEFEKKAEGKNHILELNVLDQAGNKESLNINFFR